MIRATFTTAVTAAASAVESRTVSGVAVPYGVDGRVSTGETVRFEAGSLDPASRPPLLRDHDRGRPIGRVTAVREHPDRLEVDARVSSTRDGDEALILAADDVLAMFSVGVEPTDWSHDPDGVLIVKAADWQELSLLTLGAFPDARVSSVTAQGATIMSTPTDPDVPPEDDQPDDPDEPGTVEAAPVPVPLAASKGPRLNPSPYRDVSLRQLSGLIAAAASDVDQQARLVRVLQAAGPLSRGASVEAALTDVTMVGTGNVGASVRPAFQNELAEIVNHGSPIVNVLRQGDLQRGDFPNKTYTAWTATPNVEPQSAEKAEVSTGPVSIGVQSTPVVTWATANDVSLQTIDLGSPSFVEDYIRAAGADYATEIDTYAATQLLAIATAATVIAGADFTTILGSLFAALNPANVPPGRFFLAVSWDQAVSLIGTKEADGPAFWDGSISFGTNLPTADMGGLVVFVDPNLPAATYLLGQSQAATWYDLPGSPQSIRALNVGQLGLDVGVYGYGALGVQYPGAFAKATATLAGARSSK